MNQLALPLFFRLPRKRRDPHTGEIMILAGPPQFIRTWEQAEENAVAWMRALGYRDARIGRRGADGGIDVHSTAAFAQVKCRAELVGRPELQQLYGARGDDERELWFFASSGYADTAKEYANQHSIYLFTYSATGELRPANKLAEAKLAELLAKRARRIEKWKANYESHRAAKRAVFGLPPLLAQEPSPVLPAIVGDETLDVLFARAFPDPRSAFSATATTARATSNPHPRLKEA